jgi:hypothetical protein
MIENADIAINFINELITQASGKNISSEKSEKDILKSNPTIKSKEELEHIQKKLPKDLPKHLSPAQRKAFECCWNNITYADAGNPKSKNYSTYSESTLKTCNLPELIHDIFTCLGKEDLLKKHCAENRIVRKERIKSLIEEYWVETGKDVLYDIINKTREKWNPLVIARCEKLNVLGLSTHNRDKRNIDELWKPISLSLNDSNENIVEEASNFLSKILNEESSCMKDEDRKILIYGGQGFGKTSLLKLLAKKCCDEKFQSDCVPLFLSMRRIYEDNQSNYAFNSVADLFEFIEKFFQKRLIEPDNIKKIFEEGKVLLLLDGIDFNRQVLNTVTEFTDKYKNNVFILTSRRPIEELASNFKTYEIKGFDEESRDKFINMWFHKKEKTVIGNDLIQLIKKSDPKSFISNFSKSPLFLQFVCLSCEYYKNEDINFSELEFNDILIYKKALFALILDEDGDPEYNFDREDKIYKEFNVFERINLLSYLAFRSLQDGQGYYIYTESLVQYIREYLSKLNKPEVDMLNFKSLAESAIRSIEIQDGLLINRLWNQYAFSHTTIHDFFASWYISQNLHQWENWKKLKSYSKIDKKEENIVSWKRIFEQTKQILSVNLEEFDHHFLKNIRCLSEDDRSC